MPIRKLTKSKSLTKSKRLSKSKRGNKTTKLSKSKRLTKSHKKLNKKLKSRKNKTTNKQNRNHNRNHNHRGGFFGSSNCNIATVKEPGFNLAALGSGATQITGFAIPDQKAIIYDPQCKTDLYQAMVP